MVKKMASFTLEIGLAGNQMQSRVKALKDL